MQAKLAASAMLPVPLWRATSGYGHSGRQALYRIVTGGAALRGGPASRVRGRIAERLRHLTPEQRERLRQAMRARWALKPPASESKRQ